MLARSAQASDLRIMNTARDFSPDRTETLPRQRGGSILFVILGFAFLGGLLFLLIDPSESLRYRLTYEINVNGNTHIATGVVELLVRNSETNYGEVIDKIGEAIPIDLGNGKYLFSLLDTLIPMAPDKFLTRAFGKRYHTLKENQPSMQLPFRLLPVLVTFGDITDPSTIRIVDPDDLASHFGTGVTIERVTLEITGDAVTVGQIRKLLPWLRGWKGIWRTNRKFLEYDFIT